MTSKGRGGRRYLPYAFTEQGVAMLSSVLRSQRAVQVNIEIMRAFVRLRDMLASEIDLNERLETLELRVNDQFTIVFEMIDKLSERAEKPGRMIGFNIEAEQLPQFHFLVLHHAADFGVHDVSAFGVAGHVIHPFVPFAFVKRAVEDFFEQPAIRITEFQFRLRARRVERPAVRIERLGRILRKVEAEREISGFGIDRWIVALP